MTSSEHNMDCALYSQGNELAASYLREHGPSIGQAMLDFDQARMRLAREVLGVPVLDFISLFIPEAPFGTAIKVVEWGTRCEDLQGEIEEDLESIFGVRFTNIRDVSLNQVLIEVAKAIKSGR